MRKLGIDLEAGTYLMHDFVCHRRLKNNEKI